MKRRCVVCQKRDIEELTDARYNKLCPVCWESWKVAAASICLSEWAARRSRRYERARQRDPFKGRK